MKTAITPTRQEDYPEWYQQVIKAADLAENSPVRGCMVIKPWGYGIWEKIQQELDRRIKATGHENVYFPLFIPLSFLEKEASHVEGFAKECAIVTHHRLEGKDGKLIPAGELEEPLVVRPTSETIIGHSFSKWIRSHRDLPMLINQWANVVRWEMRTRMFLRTMEFLWQEGHTAHATEEEAVEEAEKMLEEYRTFCKDFLAMPVICGEKTPQERFPGAVTTYAMEAMMQDRKALQAGTSHYLGQNFAKAFDITFSDTEGALKHVYMTSWGVATRLIGGVIMTHSDDDGLRLPPRIAPKQVVIIPFLTKEEHNESVMKYANDLADDIRAQNFHGHDVTVVVDDRDMRGGEKNWHWIKKGMPIRIEVGPRDIENNNVCMARRDKGHKDKEIIARNDIVAAIVPTLDDIQNTYLEQALKMQKENSRSDIADFEEFKAFFTPKNANKPEPHGGFVYAKWCGEDSCENRLSDLKVSIRCLPTEQSGSEGTCVVCGKKATIDALYAKSY
ncbi:MAG: proline--tRNA ligase [Waddliaceae bacterium]|jgi:prolyl-tRNA synthetase|nr:proline--tRNA ligase [Waddliaceae bacterium]MBT3579540.1 proline--tRNA ligase [Waddliaceae bacterium]MBT6928653.1 proline--tRNA ligase [Waddliaceae bacterium]MBT7265191.1 proline--tRNA ligase [Waddliaceae bacterium]